MKATGREALQVIVARKGAVLRGCLELPRSVDVSGEVCPASHHTSRSAISAVVGGGAPKSLKQILLRAAKRLGPGMMVRAM